MKDNPQTKRIKGKTETIGAEVALTGIMFGLLSVALLGGWHLMGLIKLPPTASHWVGAALVGYMLVGGIIITHLCVKHLLNKKG